MKTVLITGGAGFVAHHLVKEILEKTDWKIVTLDRLDYSGNLNRLHEALLCFPENERRRVKIVYHDLKAELNPLIRSEVGNVNYVLHLAAASHVDRSIEYPTEFVMDNVVGTCNILEYSRSLDSLDRFVYFSTDEVFGPAPEGIIYSENDRYNSTNPYSATKAGGEELAVAFENTYGLPLYVTHTMNVFGKRQHPEKFIPMCIRRVRDDEVIDIHSDATKTVPGSRHYIHVEDVASALLFLLSQDISVEHDFGGAKCPKFNIAGAEELDNLQLAQMIANVQGKELLYEMVEFPSSRPGYDFRYAVSGEKMRRLGWTPANDVRTGVEEVVSWTLDNPRWLSNK